MTEKPLGQMQEEFAKNLTLLLVFIHSNGYKVRLGHALRCDDCKVGKDDSLHKLKLAQDLNIFKDDAYLTKSEEHKMFGEFWESLGGSWGGRFNESFPGAADGTDGNHYSLSYQGRR